MLPGNIVRSARLPPLPMHCDIGANSRKGTFFSFENIVVTLCVVTFRVKKLTVVTFRVDVTFCVESCYISR